ncbi:PAS domain-containing sensor histidine kinase [Aestuariivirga sp.]|uniref:PAS domain-containing sensor histidine kinase n=1 Tax=Aestuariivirga sp. TaxID=2650926 RepID=UPI003BAD8002
MFDRQNNRGQSPKDGTVMQGEEGWALQALSVARIVFYSIDCATGFMVRSDNCTDILGVPAAGPAAAWSTVIFAEDRPQYESAQASLTPASPSYEVEYRVQNTRTGKQFWALDRGAGEFDAEGRLTGIRGAIIDVSARISVERELRKAARLRTVVFEAARMAAWHFDVVADRFTFTDELLALLEIDRKQFDGTPEALESAIHPDDREAWRRSHDRARTPGNRIEVEFRLTVPGPRVRWLLSRGEVVRRVDGAPLESFGVMIDITERKAAEEAAARLAAIVESSEEAIIAKTLRGVVTSWNKGAERLFGYTAEEMIGESIWKLIPEDGEHEEINILNTVRIGQSVPSHESVRLHRSGRRIHLAVSVSPILNAQGMVVGASTIARDVTERKRQTELLRENEARMRLALKSARAGAWNFDLRRRELHWSPEMFALYGLDPAKGLPSREQLAQRISPSHRRKARKDFAKAMLQGGSFTLEFPILRPDGTEIWTALAGDVIKDERGRPVSARGIDQDITERKTWEKRQAMLLRELSHRVKNTLAVVQSVARQTLRSSSSPKNFVDAFEGRIRSLAASHSLLTEADWGGARMETIIRHQVAAMVHDYDGRFRLKGPEVLLSAEVATQLGLVLHELGTNAAKYGSLSVPEGHVDVVWTATKSKLCLMWREHGGPKLEKKPAFKGFGTLLITSSAQKVTQRFLEDGLIYKLEFAL